MTNYPSVDRLADLQLMIAELAKVQRRVTHADRKEFENDVEHSYGLAMTCWFLQPKIAPELELLEVLKFALAHDIVEIHAGDAYFLEKEAFEMKDEKERAAIKQLRKDWPDFVEPINYAEKYMDKDSPESRFVKAVDKLLPVLMLGIGEGFEVHYKRNGLTLDALKDNKKTIHISKEVSPYYDAIFAWLERTELQRQAMA